MTETRPIGLIAPHPKRRPHPANGLFAQVHVGDGAVMTIPDPTSHDDGSAAWRLTWSDPEPIKYACASALESLEYLLGRWITAEEAIRRLRLMRGAYAQLIEQGQQSRHSPDPDENDPWQPQAG